MADWQTILGRTVRERRQELELTLDQASRAIGISRSHLNLIELGKATGVSRDCLASIDAGLGSHGALLALLPTANDDHVMRGEEMRRAEFNKAVVALAASLFFDPDRVVGAQTADVPLIEDLESLTTELARRQHHARPQTILGPIRAHLSYLLQLGNASLTPSLRLRLARVTAETAALAGWVAFRGTGDLVTAHAQLALGRQQAREAGDDVLLAQLLAATSSLHSSLDIPRPGEDQSSPLARSLLQAGRPNERRGAVQRRCKAGLPYASPRNRGCLARAAERGQPWDELRPPCQAARRAIPPDSSSSGTTAGSLDGRARRC
jgi:DNA-binding XRE family transcriptional regulator